MLNNVIPRITESLCLRKFTTLYCVYVGIRISQREGRCSSSHTAIIAVEQSVQRLVQQDAVDGIRRLPDVWRRVLHVGDYF